MYDLSTYVCLQEEISEIVAPIKKKLMENYTTPD